MTAANPLPQNIFDLDDLPMSVIQDIFMYLANFRTTLASTGEEFHQLDICSAACLGRATKTANEAWMAFKMTTMMSYISGCVAGYSLRRQLDTVVFNDIFREAPDEIYPPGHPIFLESVAYIVAAFENPNPNKQLVDKAVNYSMTRGCLLSRRLICIEQCENIHSPDIKKLILTGRQFIEYQETCDSPIELPTVKLDTLPWDRMLGWQRPTDFVVEAHSHMSHWDLSQMQLDFIGVTSQPHHMATVSLNVLAALQKAFSDQVHFNWTCPGKRLTLPQWVHKANEAFCFPSMVTPTIVINLARDAPRIAANVLFVQLACRFITQKKIHLYGPRNLELIVDRGSLIDTSRYKNLLMSFLGTISTERDMFFRRFGIRLNHKSCCSWGDDLLHGDTFYNIVRKLSSTHCKNAVYKILPNNGHYFLSLPMHIDSPNRANAWAVTTAYHQMYTNLPRSANGQAISLKLNTAYPPNHTALRGIHQFVMTIKRMSKAQKNLRIWLDLRGLKNMPISNLDITFSSRHSEIFSIELRSGLLPNDVFLQDLYEDKTARPFRQYFDHLACDQEVWNLTTLPANDLGMLADIESGQKMYSDKRSLDMYNLGAIAFNTVGPLPSDKEFVFFWSPTSQLPVITGITNQWTTPYATTAYLSNFVAAAAKNDRSGETDASKFWSYRQCIENLFDELTKQFIDADAVACFLSSIGHVCARCHKCGNKMFDVAVYSAETCGRCTKKRKNSSSSEQPSKKRKRKLTP